MERCPEFTQELALADGQMAIRHLFFGLATYPGLTLSNPKFYAGAIGVGLGSVGTLLAKLGYCLGIWKRGRSAEWVPPNLDKAAAPNANR